MYNILATPGLCTLPTEWLASSLIALGMLFSLPCHAADLTIAVTRSSLSLPVDVAQAQGYFAAEGVQVHITECSIGQRCLQQLFDRSAQLATASELPVVLSSFERADYALVATIVTSTGNIKLIGRKSAGATKPAQLVGKRIGVIVGSSSHYYLNTYLLYHDIDPRQITLVALAPENIVSALEQRQIDAFAGHSRHTGPALKALGADGVVLEDLRLYTETYNLVADRRTLLERRGEVVKVLRALQRAERFIAEHPQQAKRIMQTRSKLDPAFVDAIFPSFDYRLSLDQSLVSTMEGMARWSLREGHVAGGQKIPNYLGFVEAGPLSTAVPALFDK